MKARRTILLIIAGVLFVVVVYLYIISPAEEEAAVAEVRVVLAREALDTYSLVGDISSFRPVTRTLAAAQGMYQWGEFQDLIGSRTLVTSRSILPNDMIARSDILPVGAREFRPGEPELGIISIYVPTDKIMGGKVRPGVRLDIYGYRTEAAERSADTLLVATDVWVVDVHSATGEEVVRPTAEAEDEGELGGLLPPAAGLERVAPANILTLAADLSTVDSIVYWLGAKAYLPWVIMSPLSGSGGGSAAIVRRTPVLPTSEEPTESPTVAVPPTTTPVPEATPEPTAQPEATAVPAGHFRIHMSDEEGGGARTDYEEDTAVSYAVVSWTDVPQTAIRVRAYFATTGNWILDVTDVVEGTGSKSYEIRARGGKFEPGPYLTFLYAEPGLSVLDMVWWMVDTTAAVGSPPYLPTTGSLDGIPDHFRGK